VEAYEFGDLVHRIGGAAARRLLAQRRTRGEESPIPREFTTAYLDKASALLTGIDDGTRDEYGRVARCHSSRSSASSRSTPSTAPTLEGGSHGRRLSRGAARGQTIAAKTVRNYHGVQDAAAEAPAEFRILMYFIPDYYKPLVLFLAGTGCRWGEAMAITWADTNLWAKTRRCGSTRRGGRPTAGRS
jgi:integrase